MKDAPWIHDLPSLSAKQQSQAALALALGVVSLLIIVVCFVYLIIASGKV
jgi:hypothetical protein